jgi:hypothetical protein
MKRFVILSLIFSLITASHGFIPISSKSWNHPRRSTLSSAIVDYETVKVDLSDGRDYPIYIGAGFSETEGEFRCRFQYWISK